jgi:hypothetical protein
MVIHLGWICSFLVKTVKNKPRSQANLMKYQNLKISHKIMELDSIKEENINQA